MLATNGGVVLKFADRIETGVPGRLAFTGVSDTLRDKPTLVISLINPAAGPQNLELSYLTHGLSWRADYVAELLQRGVVIEEVLLREDLLAARRIWLINSVRGWRRVALS